MKRLTCPISSIEYYNHDTRRVLLDLPPGETADFKAGQYLKMVLPERKCPFSIASSPGVTDQIELHVRPTPDSDDSAAIEAALDRETELTVEIPFGDCYLESVPDNTLVLLAASTGITQMKSMIEFLEPKGFEHPVHLYWGIVCDRDIYLRDLCEFWSGKHRNFHFIPVVSEPATSPDWTGRTGLVGDAVLSDFDKLDGMTVFVSGGPAMVYATFDAFVARGLPKGRMHSDIFSYAPRPTTEADN